ncbi:MAG: ring-cleaving dioxygenase [Chitinophagaceae bacterium]|nr:MAG: ring-cleaving dioxygenase [Chitinophagaceae bacterium]
MSKLITGIHHVTAITSSAQGNLDFYGGVLGLRLLKQTVNFDAKNVYHFYYGTIPGTPGSVITFFPYAGLTPGRHGKGMLNTTTFSVAADSISYWEERLRKYGIAFKPARERFRKEAYIYLEDADGMGIELVFNNDDQREGYDNGFIPKQNAIKGIYNVEIWEEGYERTGALLTMQLNHELIAQEGNRYRYAVADEPGKYIDLVCTPESLKGLAGSGTVHHLAFSTPGAEEQLKLREMLVNRSLNVTPVLDRNYFTSLYFREPGGVLFEIATAGPGFTIDEDASQLGRSLKLPAQFEAERAFIERSLPVVDFNKNNFN